MTGLNVLVVTDDELEFALDVIGAHADPLDYRDRRTADNDRAAGLERKIRAEIDRGGEPSMEQLQAALELLHAAGLLTLIGPGVPADLGALVRELVDVAEHYGDHDQYARLRPGDTRPAGVDVGDPKVMVDRGARARKALRRAEGQVTRA